MQGLQLTAARIELEKQRGVWVDQVITDYLDRWITQTPGDTAIVSFR